MPSEIVRQTRHAAEACAIDAVWTQWSALTTLAAPLDRPPARSIVDPEALVLASLLLSPSERRLEDVLAAWSRAAGFLLSKARFKRLTGTFPDSAGARLGDFARYAVEGGESRWRAWASLKTPGSPAVREKRPGQLRLIEGPSLVLRLRAGLGVNAKADLFAILLGFRGAPADLKLVAAASGYTERMVRTATKEMVLARLIHEIEGHPSSFYIDPEPWTDLLGLSHLDTDDPGSPSIPPWRFWSAALGFLCDVSGWGRTAEEGAWSDYVAGSKARDLFGAHRLRLRQAGIGLRPSDWGSGADNLRLLRETVLQVCAWTADSL